MRNPREPFFLSLLVVDHNPPLSGVRKALSCPKPPDCDPAGAREGKASSHNLDFNIVRIKTQLLSLRWLRYNDDE
jgi:hypothetical protein